MGLLKLNVSNAISYGVMSEENPKVISITNIKRYGLILIGTLMTWGGKNETDLPKVLEVG